MLLRRLHPDGVVEVDSMQEYAVPDTGRHLRVNMVASVDGAAAVDGRVGLLSGTADQVLLHELRTLCDVLLVGAGTIRAEGYGPIRLTDAQQRARLDRGQAPVPRLAVLSRSLDLDLAAPVFARATARPLVLTTRESAGGQRGGEVAQVADVLVADDLATGLDGLADAGLARVLSEGGPHVLHQLYAADLVDELCLAVAPVVTGGTELRVTAGAPVVPPRVLRLAGVAEADGFLFLRYRRGES